MEKQKKPSLGHSILSWDLASTYFYLDQLLPLGMAGGGPYIAIILIGLWAESRKLILVNTCLATVLTILGFFLSPANSDSISAMNSESNFAVFNRAMAIATHWLTAYFCLMNLRLLKEKDRGDVLEKANKQIKKEKGYVELNRDIAQFTNLSHSLDEAIQYSLKTICEFTGWPVGHLYLLDEDGKTLSSSEIWFLENEESFGNFREVTQQSQLAQMAELVEQMQQQQQQKI